jgi:hypothetical protein
LINPFHNDYSKKIPINSAKSKIQLLDIHHLIEGWGIAAMLDQAKIQKILMTATLISQGL